jgi:hypothetical protein
MVSASLPGLSAFTPRMRPKYPRSVSAIGGFGFGGSVPAGGFAACDAEGFSAVAPAVEVAGGLRRGGALSWATTPVAGHAVALMTVNQRAAAPGGAHPLAFIKLWKRLRRRG